MLAGLGGNTVAEQRELRQGFDALPREFKAARNRVSLKFVFQGSRTATRDAFMAKINQMSPRVVPVLLVDSKETPQLSVSCLLKRHLNKRLSASGTTRFIGKSILPKGQMINF